MKKYIVLSLKSVCAIGLCAIVGFLLLLLVYAFPTSSIHKHIGQSTVIFLTERDYPRVHSWTDMWRDNYTDAIMIGHAGYEGRESILDKALFVYRTNASYQGNSLLPAETLIAVFSDDAYKDDPDFSFGRSNYSRYWHGYLILLKPLLCLFTYGQIRTINAVLQTILLILALYLMWKKNVKGMMIPFIVIWSVLIPMDTGALLQYSDIYYIYTFGSIVLLINFERLKTTNIVYYVFLGLGIATGYFDFLTYPIVALSIPLGIYLFLNHSSSIKEELVQMLVLSAFWGMGYLGMWACKWILVSIFTDVKIMDIVFRSIGKWTSNVSDLGESVTFFSTVIRLFSVVIVNPAFQVFILYTIVTGSLSIIFKKCKKRDFVVYGVLALYPFLWFAVVKSHSYSHYWFTHKDLIAFCFALMLMFSSNLALISKKGGSKKKKRMSH